MTSDRFEDMMAICQLATERGVQFSTIENLDAVPRKETNGVARKKSTRWAGRHALAVIEHMKAKPAGTEFFYKDLGQALLKTGLRASCISAVLSEMTKSNRVKKTRKGFYALA